MTEETEQNDEMSIAEAMSIESLAAGNSKPDTAEGVASLLDASRNHVSEAAKASISVGRDDEVIVLKPDGTLAFIDDSLLDQSREVPRFRRGVAVLTDVGSFIQHVRRFGDSDSAVFVTDGKRPEMNAVLDYHRHDTMSAETPDGMDHGEYRHGLHRSHFSFPLSNEWQRWSDKNGTKMSMGDFARFLESSMDDFDSMDGEVPPQYDRFVSVNGGEKRIASFGNLLDLSRNLRVHEHNVVDQAVTLSSGEGSITMSSEHETTSGGSKIQVPTMFFIAIPIFERGDFYRLPVKLRYHKTNSGVQFSYELHRPDVALRSAVDETVEQVKEAINGQVFYGTPESSTFVGDPLAEIDFV